MNENVQTTATSDVEHRIFPDGLGQEFLDTRGLPPPWRDLNNSTYRGSTHVVTDRERDAIKAAFLLRRPLLITGDPGVGKSSLAYAVADELGLGQVLVWPVTSRTILQDGLYSYDAIGRLNKISIEEKAAGEGLKSASRKEEAIGDYLTLGPLGMGLYASLEEKPCVVLVDEIDKSDVDLPNDLLHVLEEGVFSIRELARLKEKTIPVRPFGGGESVPIEHGVVKAKAVPFILMTSNGEREFPPAFLRRCLRLEVTRPTREDLERIVKQKLGPGAPGEKDLSALLDAFITARDQENRMLATDQFLNAAFLVAGQAKSPEKERLLSLALQALQ